MIKHGPTGIPYASLAGVHNSIRRHVHEPSWQGAWFWCLKHNDEESAHIIRFHNDPDYEEECREAGQIPFGSAPLLSCLEVSHDDEDEEENHAREHKSYLASIEREEQLEAVR